MTPAQRHRLWRYILLPFLGLATLLGGGAAVAAITGHDPVAGAAIAFGGAFAVALLGLWAMAGWSLVMHDPKD